MPVALNDRHPSTLAGQTSHDVIARNLPKTARAKAAPLVHSFAPGSHAAAACTVVTSPYDLSQRCRARMQIPLPQSPHARRSVALAGSRAWPWAACPG